jgi:hypothetical protein
VFQRGAIAKVAVITDSDIAVQQQGSRLERGGVEGIRMDWSNLAAYADVSDHLEQGIQTGKPAVL